MIAIGAINWDYQRRNSQVVAHSLLIIIPGLILLGMTYVPVGRKLLRHQSVRIAWIVFGVAALIYAFPNR